MYSPSTSLMWTSCQKRFFSGDFPVLLALPASRSSFALLSSSACFLLLSTLA